MAATRVAQHDYRLCRDEGCERPYCRIWREAWEEAEETIYPEAFQDGINACPREHK